MEKNCQPNSGNAVLTLQDLVELFNGVSDLVYMVVFKDDPIRGNLVFANARLEEITG